MTGPSSAIDEISRRMNFVIFVGANDIMSWLWAMSLGLWAVGYGL